VKGFGEVEVHYLFVKSEVKGAVPLLFVRGYEFSSSVDGVCKIR